MLTVFRKLSISVWILKYKPWPYSPQTDALGKHRGEPAFPHEGHNAR